MQRRAGRLVQAQCLWLYDTLGNVSEWTEDCLPTGGLQWRGAPLDGAANLKGDCSQRAYARLVARNEKYYMRTPDRYKYIGARDSDWGFALPERFPREG